MAQIILIQSHLLMFECLMHLDPELVRDRLVGVDKVARQRVHAHFLLVQQHFKHG